ncbi:MAG: SlyX family protein [Alphaproteobacteria bacterium]|nr:SlyX family protein [Alphaproteobacteria bacterium]
MTDRTEELEIRLAYLERTAEELSDVAAAQAREIDRLQARLAAAERRLRDMGEAVERAVGAEREKPPHY